MFSAWAESWGVSWGNSWGLAKKVAGGGGPSGKSAAKVKAPDPIKEGQLKKDPWERLASELESGESTEVIDLQKEKELLLLEAESAQLDLDSTKLKEIEARLLIAIQQEREFQLDEKAIIEILQMIKIVHYLIGLKIIK